MAWTAPTANDVLQQFTPHEEAALKTLQGDNAGANLASILSLVVAKVRGAVRSGGYPLDADPTKIPGDLFDAAVALARWRYLIGGRTAGKVMQTAERKAANDAAEALLKQTAAQEYVPEPPETGGGGTVPRAGSWNSEQKLVMRTHPIPPPAAQYQAPGAPSPYANPTAPADTTGATEEGA